MIRRLALAWGEFAWWEIGVLAVIWGLSVVLLVVVLRWLMRDLQRREHADTGE